MIDQQLADDSPSLNRRRLQFTVRLLLLLMVVVAVGGYWLRPRYVNVEYTIAGFVEETDPVSQEPYLAARVRVRNRAPNAIWYVGSNEGHPMFHSEQTPSRWPDGWHDFYAADWFILPRGNSFVLTVPLCDEASRMKLCLEFATRRHGDPQCVWSEEFAIQRPPKGP